MKPDKPKRTFDKPPKTFEEQVDLLQSRGMIIDDRSAAPHYLAHLNYYRLTAYWLPFQENRVTHRFKPGTLFSKVVDLYMFDKKLRLLLLNAIERIEVSVRTQWAYHFAHKHGAHAYLDQKFASDKDRFERDRKKLGEELKRSDEKFIVHYKRTYEPSTPPIWVICEIISLGLLSRWFGNLNSGEVRGAIAKTYGLDDRVMESLLRHLAYVRNLCAHHGRIWNRKFTITVKIPKSKPARLIRAFNLDEKRNLYNTLVLLSHSMDVINPSNEWKEHLLHLIDEHEVNVSSMGFPANYREYDIWKS
uniref:Abortive infection bacteriophage resistance protein n=1 Tax=Candidatus Kentrum sp. TC TaxID=2126339 RepID=A0A451A7R3_9GAMM|nr:MAG: Abortive infection bacteriophage resistance protein [Candidatus Kentron sp. TC]